jgi:DNA-binding SARP family transcriptional activator/tetratricopeptide (TPR) repeat protein
LERSNAEAARASVATVAIRATMGNCAVSALSGPLEGGCVRFRVLGPIEALDDHGRVLPCAGQQLRLLGLLLVSDLELVPTDVAIDALWSDALPAHPANALQLVVSRLRRVVGEQTIVFDAGGYGLDVDDDEATDARRFERLLAAGRTAIDTGEHGAGAERLREALGLWRGHAFQDIRYEPFAAVETRRLEALRLACVEARIEADLALGRHAGIVGEVHALVEEHPLRENLRAQLMLALYRCGRQADALAAYRAGQRMLAEELGLQPSPTLRGLERAILRHDSRLLSLDQSTPRSGRREVVCVAADVRATDAGDPLDPEILRSVMERCHRVMEDVSRTHGDPLRELRADGMTAVFGSPVAHEDDASRAVGAAFALRERLAALGEELAGSGIVLETRTSLTAGTTLTPDGPAGASLPVGDAVTAAPRLARDADHGEIVIDDACRALVGDAVVTQVRSAGSFVLTAQRAAAMVGPPRAALVGRRRELAALSDVFERCTQGHAPHLATVLGEPGIGKSRLARELADHLAGRATVLLGRCRAYGEGITYWPLREMVVALAGDRPLEHFLHEAEDAAAVAASVSATLGLGEGAPGEATPWAFRRLFTLLARDRPVLLVFEDVHWAQPPLLDLIEHLAARLAGAPVTLLCLARPELLTLRPAWGADALHATSLPLRRLSDDDSRALLRAGRALTEADVARVADRAAGNPLFLEQLAMHVAERTGTMRLPPALRALLAARLDLLGHEERALVDAGAIEGETFHLGGVLALVPDTSRSEAATALDGLVARELLAPERAAIGGETAWGFRHALVRDAAYASLPKQLRVDGHERLAGWLAQCATDVPEADARIGWHLERACWAAAELGQEPARRAQLAAGAAQRLGAAAEAAHQRGDLPSEIAFLDRATGLVAEDDPARAELLTALAAALFEAGTLERATTVAEQAHALGERLGLARVRWLAAVELERLRLFTHPERVDVDASLLVSDRAAKALRAQGDDLGLARARYLNCELVWLTGRSEAGFRSARDVVRHARRAGSGFEVDTGVAYMAWALVVNRTPVSKALQECAALERAVVGRFAELSVQGFRAVLHAMAGRFAPAREQLARSRRGLEELGLQQASVWMAVYAAVADVLAGDLVAAERALDDAERIAEAIGDRWFYSTILVDRAHVLLAQERPEAAAAAVERIERTPVPTDMEWRIKRHAARAKLAARQGDPRHALAEARRATTLADGTEMHTFRADAHRDLADVAWRTGDHEVALNAATLALRLYDVKENVATAAQLRARLPARALQADD